MTKFITRRTKTMSKISFLRYACSLMATLLVIPGCVPRMSLEEAKKVSVSIEETPLVKPPRRINDILAVLNQPGKYDVNVTKRLRSQVSAMPPGEATDEVMAAFYQQRGDAALQLGYPKQALDDLREAMRYSQSSGYVNPNLLLRLGEAELTAGNFQKAVDLFQRSLVLRKQSGAYITLAYTYIAVGDMEAAEKLINEGKGTMFGSRSNYTEADINRLMRMVPEAQGRHVEAEQLLREELKLRSSQSSRPQHAIETRLDLSQNLNRQNRYLESEIEARQAVKEALGLGGARSNLTSKGIQRLAGVMLAQGRINDAEQLARVSIRILDSMELPAESQRLSSARMFLGNVLTRKEDFPEAMKQFDLVREGMEEDTHRYVKLFSGNLNVLLTLLKTGRLAEAMQMIAQRYDLDRKNLGGKHQGAMQVLGLRGMANAMAGNNRQAFEDYSSALPTLIKKGAKQDDGPNQIKRAILETYIDLLSRMPGTPLEQELGIRASDEAFRIAGYLGGQSLKKAFGESSARAAASYDPQLSDFVRQEQDMGKQISALQETLSEAMMAPPDQQEPKALNSLKTSIENQTRARDLILGEINRRFPKYANFTSPPPVTIDEVRASLQPNEALISIFTADEKTYVWAVPKKGETRFSVTSLGKMDLTQMVSHLRQTLDPNPRTLGDIPAFDLVQAYDLYSKILQPVEPAWKEAKDLLITVNGPLGNLPLSLLPTEPVKLTEEKDELFANYRRVPWLVRKASVTMLPSVNALVTLRSLPEGDPKRKAFAGFGDPIFSREQLARDENAPANTLVDKETPSSNIQMASRGTKVQVRGVRVTEKGNLDSDKIASAQLDGLDRLPDTAEEIRSIARVLKADTKSDIFMGKDFSQDRLRTMNLSDRRVIAFATHALVPGDLDGLDQPALALSSPTVTGGKGDGLLTTDEILKMKLNADWVVLSACNTGAAEGKGAEAVSGLGKAFFYAGTRALLVSMWSVETTSAQKLVTGIFQSQEENKGLSRARALQKSILNLIDKETMKDNATGKIAASYAHPLFWAPFVIVGDPGKSI